MENNPAQPPSPDQTPPQEPPVQDLQIPPVPQNPTPSETNLQSPPPNNENSNRTIIAILLLLFVYPIGLIFMWLGTKWPKWVKFLLTAPIILAILGIALAVFLATLDPSHKIEEARSHIVKTATPTPVDKTGNWNTYQGKGFSLKYPLDWKIVQNSTDSATFYPPTSDPNLPSPAVFVNFDNIPYSSYVPPNGTSAPSSIVIDKVKGIEFEDNGLPPLSYHAVLPLSSGSIFLNSDLELKDQAKKILSTFKITNSPKETLDKFYKAYLSCLNAETNPEDLFSASYKCYEQFIKDPEIDQALEKSNLANLKANFSSLICSSNIPESISFGQAEIKDKNAKVIATRIYKEGIRSEEKPFTVDLISASGTWKINKIICQ